MVGLGWYLDVIGSESHVLVWVLRIFFFFEKNHKKKENGNLGKTGPFAAVKGCLTVVRSRAKNPPLSGSLRCSPVTPRRSALPQRSSAMPR